MEKAIKPNTSIQPRVNTARAFFEIANNFSNNLEILREALSNSYDADATEVKITFELKYGTTPGLIRAGKIIIKIEDNGTGMSSTPENSNECSALEAFFNLGDSNKNENQIGSKGHGTKIYYKSKKIKLNTWKDDKYIQAETEDEHLWKTLCIPKLPSYHYIETPDFKGKGTTIVIEDFLSNHNTFESIESLKDYILWYTIIGSFAPYFNKNFKKMDVYLKSYYSNEFTKIDFGFKFPQENNSLNSGSKDFCKYIGPKSISVPIETGKNVIVQIMGAWLGENKRNSIPDTYWNMGLWLCKDFIKIKRENDLLEKIVGGGEYYYRNFLILANCQEFELTADRNNIKQDTLKYEKVIDSITTYLKEEVKNSSTWEPFFDKKKEERDKEKQEEQRKKEQERINRLEEMIENYKKRKNINTDFPNLLIKEPRNEAETILLLQSMISSNHTGIDFKIGGYNANYGTDLLIEFKSKGSHKIEWAEAVYTLERLFQWSHPSESYHKVICWEIGNFENTVNEKKGITPNLNKKGKGRYNLNFGSDTVDLYVLKEILYDRE